VIDEIAAERRLYTPAEVAAREQAGEEAAIKLIADHLRKCGLKPFWVRSVLRLAHAAAEDTKT
jgi:hypothetical protein